MQRQRTAQNEGTARAVSAPAVPTGQPDRWGERLPRQVGLVNAVAVLVGVTIGSGIFRVPATVAGQLHDPGPAILCWILGGLIALFGALTIAELDHRCRALARMLIASERSDAEDAGLLVAESRCRR